MYCDWPYLGRCCFCIPLRRGVLACAYTHMFFGAFMLGLYSYAVNYAMVPEFMDLWRFINVMPAELCVAFYCLELVFDAVLIFGAHKKVLKYVKAFYYYTLGSCVAFLIIQIVEIAEPPAYTIFEKSIFTFGGTLIQLYLITLVRSLIHDMETSGHTYDNQLHQIVNGELKDSNGIYNTTTVVPLDAQDS